MPNELTPSGHSTRVGSALASLRARRWGVGPRLRRRLVERPRESAISVGLALIVCAVATGCVSAALQTLLFAGGIALVCIDDRLARRKSS